MYLVRKARVSDVQQIYHQLHEFAREGLMLPRSLSELYDVLRDFHVACLRDDENLVAGFCALHVSWEELGEIRSLGVISKQQGQDLGRLLVEACISEAGDLGLTRIFVLTYIPDYFKKRGFHLTDRNKLPQKIWAECFKCVKFPECGEIALEKDL